MNKISLETPLDSLHGIGPRFSSKLKKLGLVTVKDLLWHFPSRYEDWSKIVSIAELKKARPYFAKASKGTTQEAERKTIRAAVKEIDIKRTWTRRRMVIVEATLEDESGEIKAVWFNQPYIKNILKTGTKANFAGKISLRENEIYLQNPTYEISSSKESKHTGRIVPIYPETKGLTSKGLRYMIKSIIENLEDIKEFIPEEILNRHKLLYIKSAIQKIHFPRKIGEAGKARQRFSFEELFLLQMRNLKQRLMLHENKAPQIQWSEAEVENILDSLPFPLTKAQKKSLYEILKDISISFPMNRLLQGDVGSGKTIVAGIAALLTAENHQVAIMAPTEILARQHYRTLTRFFGAYDRPIALLLSKDVIVFYGDKLESKIDKQALIKEISAGRIKMVIGTHALIQKGVSFKNLGLLIIDEQHRFGVNQRKELLGRSRNENSLLPHFLSMSATPIPRTLMMAVFGDLDVSQITELPAGRKNIITKIVDHINRAKAYAFIRGQVRRGRQVFVVCPRIEPSTNSESDTNIRMKNLELWDVKAVKEEYEKLSKNVFPDLKVSMLHGKMKGVEKAKIMHDLSHRNIDVLVTTSVIEVGIDVPNANIIMIEGADRFGLAQLYQLRGRVGRGEYQSFCFLFTESGSNETNARLRSIIEAKNGLELAEKDLSIRGPGELLGNEQTGIPDIAMDALKDIKFIKAVRDSANSILNKDPGLNKYPELKKRLSVFEERVHLE